MPASEAMEPSILKVQELNEFGTYSFPEPPDESPAGQHLEVGLVTL